MRSKLFRLLDLSDRLSTMIYRHFKLKALIRKCYVCFYCLPSTLNNECHDQKQGEMHMLNKQWPSAVFIAGNHVVQSTHSYRIPFSAFDQVTKLNWKHK